MRAHLGKLEACVASDCITKLVTQSAFLLIIWQPAKDEKKFIKRFYVKGCKSMSKSLAAERRLIELGRSTSVALLQEIKARRAAGQPQQRLTLSYREESSNHASDGVA